MSIVTGSAGSMSAVLPPLSSSEGSRTNHAMLRAIATLAAWTLGAAAASAGCVGSTDIRTCTDGLGNTYAIQRLGGFTFVTGINDLTGETWTETTQRIGGVAVTHGEGGGRSWEGTESHVGPGLVARSGTDPEGRTYEHLCDRDGCGQAGAPAPR